MLLDEDPAVFIAQCTSNFHSRPDLSSISRISDSLSTLSSSRQLRLKTLQTDLKKLARTQQALSAQHDMNLREHDARRHAEEILRLDAEKFRVAKGVRDAEVEGERLEAELAGLRQNLAEMEERGVEGGENRLEDDEIILKLKVYRTLGIDLEPDQTTGVIDKAIVRNTAKGDVHVVNIDPKFSRFFYANYFWNTL